MRHIMGLVNLKLGPFSIVLFFHFYPQPPLCIGALGHVLFLKMLSKCSVGEVLRGRDEEGQEGRHHDGRRRHEHEQGGV